MAPNGNYVEQKETRIKKIDPKLAKRINETLNLVEEGKRLEFLDWTFNETEETTEAAKKYAESNKVDYETALKHVMAERDAAFKEKMAYFHKKENGPTHWDDALPIA